MSMTRAQIYTIIEKEREHQDLTWPRDRRRKEYYSNSGPHVLLLIDYIEQARATWRKSKSSVPTTQVIGKIAAIAIRALEEVRDSEQLLEKGLCD